MRAQLPRELHAYGDMVGNRAALNTGAPSITYQGQEGPQAGGQPRPEEIIMQLQEAYKQHVAQGGQLTFEEFVEVVINQNQNRQPAAFGGIMGADGRRQYGIGSWFQKKIMDPIKKNPVVSAAAAALAADQFGIPGTNIGGNKVATNWLSNVFKKVSNVGRDKGVTVGDNWPDTPSSKNPTPGNKSIWGSIGEGIGGLASSALSNPNFLIPAAGLISGAFAKEDDPGYTGQGTGLNLRDIGKIANISDEKVGQAAGLRFLPQVSARKYTPEEMIATYATTDAEDFSTPETKAQGGRIGYALGESVEPTQKDQMQEIEGQMAGPQWWWDRVQHLEYLGYSPEQASQIAMDDDAYFEIVGGPKMAQGGRIGAADGGEISINKIEMLIRKGADNDLIKTYVEGSQDGVIDQIREAMKKRQGKAEGGLMSLGGMEMDLRGGGFVPIGEREKADDVPARLSKNEFVFTADAVRAAGDGDVNKGADKMYRTMKELEGVVA